MPRVFLHIFLSLDGFYARPNSAFRPPQWSVDMANWAKETVHASGHLIYGRLNFQFNKEFWSAAETDPNSPAASIDYAKDMNALPKTVFSTTLRGDPGWNATVASGDPTGVVARLKSSATKDIFLLGSGTLARSFIAQDLIDEYRFLILPEIWGEGLRLFEPGQAKSLRHLGTRTLDTGAVFTRYAPARKA